MDSPRLINPKGCQRVAGGRSPFAPNDHRKTTSRWPSTQKGCQNLGDRNPWQEGVSVLWGNANLEQAVTGLALLPECRTSPAPLPGGRRPQKPSATLRLPSGNPPG